MFRRELSMRLVESVHGEALRELGVLSNSRMPSGLTDAERSWLVALAKLLSEGPVTEVHTPLSRRLEISESWSEKLARRVRRKRMIASLDSNGKAVWCLTKRGKRAIHTGTRSSGSQ